MTNVSPKVLLLSSLCVLALSGCSERIAELKNIGKDPKMESVSIPMTKPEYEPLEWPDPEDDEADAPQYSNSLWQPGSRAFFKDIKARRVGDILKVTIKVKDKAELASETANTRDNTENSNTNKAAGLENKLVGLISGEAIPANLLDLSSKSNMTGTGSIKRDETIETDVAAMVTQILPNGNLVVHGDQEIRINSEIRKVTVDGIVRPEDISADNSVDSKQIAEARISYGGRGQVTGIQRARWGSQLLDLIVPF